MNKNGVLGPAERGPRYIGPDFPSSVRGSVIGREPLGMDRSLESFVARKAHWWGPCR